VDVPAEVRPSDALTGLTAGDDPEWFKRAVFYEVLVRGFADSGGDGSGDLGGLISKLDYLHWLGVDCLWLPPFYPSACCPSSAPWRTSAGCWTRRTRAACG
jgi:maltose alpha-D-glucosyltransferase/alpha-amylase